jgi:FkbM family methyltransferase
MYDLVEYQGLKFNYRSKTTDWGIIQEACGGLNTLFFDVVKDERWIDIGAHIGSFSVYAASKGALVDSFEPVPDNFNLLRSNVSLNGFSDYITAHNAAVTKSTGYMDIFIDTLNYGNCSKYSRGNTSTVTVKTIPACILTEHDNTCFKIDTEGAEYEIIKELDLSKVKKLILEDHHWMYGKEVSDSIRDLVRQNFSNVEYFQDYMVYAWK